MKLFVDIAAEPRSAQTYLSIYQENDTVSHMCSYSFPYKIKETYKNNLIYGEMQRQHLYMHMMDTAMLMFPRAYLFDTSSHEPGMSPDSVSTELK